MVHLIRWIVMIYIETGFIEDILLSQQHKMTREEYNAAYDYYSSDHKTFQRMQERLKKKDL